MDSYADLPVLLSRYKAHFSSLGVETPLKVVPHKPVGLLQELPAAISKGWPWDEQVDPAVYGDKSLLPKLSIIIPSYNQGKFIEEAIRSVLLQNYPSLELIIMDGGSTDNTGEILEKYSKWISYWQSEKDGGQGNAINLGFSLASGDYYGWLNSDDFYNRDAFYHLAKEITTSHKEFYYGDAYSTNEDSSEKIYWNANLVLDIFLRFGGLIASHSAFWKSTAHQPIWEQMNCNVDGELWIRLVKGLSKKHVRFPLGTLRHHGSTKSHNQTWEDKWKEDDIAIEQIYGPPPAPRSFISYVNRFVQQYYRRPRK